MSSNKYDLATLAEIRKYPGQMPAGILELLLKQADMVGPCTSEVILRLWIDHLMSLYDRLNGLFALGNRWSDERLEKACIRALFYDFHSLKIIRSIILEQLDQLPLSFDTDIYGQLNLFRFD
jgi:hypothetical protein